MVWLGLSRLLAAVLVLHMDGSATRQSTMGWHTACTRNDVNESIQDRHPLVLQTTAPPGILPI